MEPAAAPVAGRGGRGNNLDRGRRIEGDAPCFYDVQFALILHGCCRKGCELLSRNQPRQRPNGRPANQRSLIVETFERGGAERAVIRVADRDHHIAHEAGPADALDRTAGEDGPERRLVEAGQFGEGRGVEVGARRKLLGLRLGVSEFVPRADGEAVVANRVNSIADRGSKLSLGSGEVLDRQVGDTTPRVESVQAQGTPWLDRRPGRRGIVRSGPTQAHRAAGRGR